MSATPAATTSRAAAPAKRTRRARQVSLADLHAEATAVVRSRWPGLDADSVAWRTVARYRFDVASARHPGDLTTWIRNTVYGFVVEDQRADHGQTAYATELDVLLRELSQPKPTLIDRALLDRAVVHLHPRDVIKLRMILAGLRREDVARRAGTSTGEVDLAYSRARTRLRATIGSDRELREALQGAHELWSRPPELPIRASRRPRPTFRRLGGPPPADTPSPDRVA